MRSTRRTRARSSSTGFAPCCTLRKATSHGITRARRCPWPPSSASTSTRRSWPCPPSPARTALPARQPSMSSSSALPSRILSRSGTRDQLRLSQGARARASCVGCPTRPCARRGLPWASRTCSRTWSGCARARLTMATGLMSLLPQLRRKLWLTFTRACGPLWPWRATWTSPVARVTAGVGVPRRQGACPPATRPVTRPFPCTP
mmetsp:Transcript_20257/g.54529  ORF Transcript_20257/g.54529 Transcript_20257/m.54529 type:complete len:204 (-) Transcript_20257:465-1076(-)